MEEKRLTVGDVTYTFPADHIFSFMNPGEGRPFARIRPPGESYDLIYSYRAKYRKNWQGSDVPLVTGINDYPSDRFEKFQFGNNVTVCREGHPYYSCGLMMMDDGVAWSVVFSKDQVQNSESIRKSVVEMLQAYRGK